MKKSETLRGRGAFRAVAAAGRRLDGRYIRTYAVVERCEDPGVLIGVTVYSRRLNAVKRNRIRRRMREAVSRERAKLAGVVLAAGVRIQAVIGYRSDAGTEGPVVPFAELQADIAHVIDGIISRIRQQWPQQ